MLDLYPDFTAHIHFFADVDVPYASVYIDSDPGFVHKPTTKLGHVVSCRFYTDDSSLDSLSPDASIRNAKYITIYFSVDGNDYGINIQNLTDIATHTDTHTRILVHNKFAHKLPPSPSQNSPIPDQQQYPGPASHSHVPSPNDPHVVLRHKHAPRTFNPHFRHSFGDLSYSCSSNNYFLDDKFEHSTAPRSRRPQRDRSTTSYISRRRFDVSVDESVPHDTKSSRLGINFGNPTKSTSKSMPQFSEFRHEQGEQIPRRDRRSNKRLATTLPARMEFSPNRRSLYNDFHENPSLGSKIYRALSRSSVHVKPRSKNFIQGPEKPKRLGLVDTSSNQELPEHLSEPRKKRRAFFGFRRNKNKMSPVTQPRADSIPANKKVREPQRTSLTVNNTNRGDPKPARQSILSSMRRIISNLNDRRRRARLRESIRQKVYGTNHNYAVTPIPHDSLGSQDHLHSMETPRSPTNPSVLPPSFACAPDSESEC